MDKVVTFFANSGKFFYRVCVNAAFDYTQQENVLKFFRQFQISRPVDVICAIGPRWEMVSSWSTNLCSIFKECGIVGVTRIEQYKCYTADHDDYDDLTEEKIQFNSDKVVSQLSGKLCDGVVAIENLASYCLQHNLGMDNTDIAFYTNLFTQKLGRNPTVAEIHDLANCNSEHSRHHIFRGQFLVPVSSYYGEFQALYPYTLMDLIKKPLAKLEDNNENLSSLVAFSDNSSAIKGFLTSILVPTSVTGPSEVRLQNVILHHTFTAETHNFPTGIAPFQGATTGTGGRIRDNQAIGKGGLFVAGTCGYCVGEIEPVTLRVDPSRYDRLSPVDILLQASDGTSDYGNKIGEPVIQGFTRSYGVYLDDNRRIEWVKPILFSGGIGKVLDQHIHKSKVDSDFLIARVGGPTYRLGINGGAASSSTNHSASNRAAVQRGDAQMENRMDRWIRACIAESINTNAPLIHSIHDQGAGGMGNVTKEIVEGVGATINLAAVTLGDDTLSDAEIWTAESQEQNTMLVRQNDIAKLTAIAVRERVDFKVIGRTNDTGSVRVLSSNQENIVVDLPLDQITPPQKTFDLTQSKQSDIIRLSSFPGTTWTPNCLEKILSRIDVGSKRFLTTKVDRSVGGLIVQQQCVGLLQTPIADVAVIANSFTEFFGAATAIGERPLIALHSVERSVRMAIGEMLTNLVWAPITAFSDIRCSGNWMWPASTIEGKSLLLNAVNAVSHTLCQLGIAIDGGKDSVSMSARLNTGERVDAPPTFVISGYVGCTDIRKVVNPALKTPGNVLWYIPFTTVSHNLQLVADSMLLNDDLLYTDRFRSAFTTIQTWIEMDIIRSGHDVSDGGIITTIIEMCFASDRYGVKLNRQTNMNVWLSERLGVVIETGPNEQIDFPQSFKIGTVEDNGGQLIFDQSSTGIRYNLSELRHYWESSATALEKRQVAGNLAQVEHDWICSPKTHYLDYSFTLQKQITFSDNGFPINSNNIVRACVMRGEGSNGDKEMISALWMAGFQVHDVTTSDLTDGRLQDLSQFKLLVFVGGFTYSDVLGAGTGWAAVLTQNTQAASILKQFRERPDTLVLGVCNGFQLLVELGWISGGRLEQNTSQRFESRFVHVRPSLSTSPASSRIWFSNLEQQIMGVWVAHGQGKWIGATNNVALNYIDWEGQQTEKYPLNPNGSVGGAAAVTDDTGRILGMMPHPERCVRSWQLAWSPQNIDWRKNNYNTYWLQMFYNAYTWCVEERA